MNYIHIIIPVFLAITSGCAWMAPSPNIYNTATPQTYAPGTTPGSLSNAANYSHPPLSYQQQNQNPSQYPAAVRYRSRYPEQYPAGSRNSGYNDVYYRYPWFYPWLSLGINLGYRNYHNSGFYYGLNLGL